MQTHKCQNIQLKPQLKDSLIKRFIYLFILLLVDLLLSLFFFFYYVFFTSLLLLFVNFFQFLNTIDYVYTYKYVCVFACEYVSLYQYI